MLDWRMAKQMIRKIGNNCSVLCTNLCSNVIHNEQDMRCGSKCMLVEHFIVHTFHVYVDRLRVYEARQLNGSIKCSTA